MQKGFILIGKDKMSTIAEVTKDVKKKYGDTKVIKASKLNNYGVLPTGILAIDNILTDGGLPKGCIVEIFGNVACGKSTLLLNIIVQAQKYGTVVLADTEFRFFPEYAKKCGVDTDKLLVIRPEYAEEALEIGEMYLRSGDVSLFAIDSVAALVPKAEVEGSMDDQQMGLQARIVSKALRKLTSVVSQTGSTMICINQLRTKIGVMFGNPEDTPGGRALKFFSTVRLDLRKVKTLISENDKKTPVGSRCRVKIIKGLGGEGKTAEMCLLYGKGVDKINDLIEGGTINGSIKLNGMTYTYKDEKIAVGRPKLYTFLAEHPEIQKEILNG